MRGQQFTDFFGTGWYEQQAYCKLPKGIITSKTGDTQRNDIKINVLKWRIVFIAYVIHNHNQFFSKYWKSIRRKYQVWYNKVNIQNGKKNELTANNIMT